jgi:hypothetical protein
MLARQGLIGLFNPRISGSMQLVRPVEGALAGTGKGLGQSGVMFRAKADFAI